MTRKHPAPAFVRFRLLDPLRGLAALWVFTFHYGFSAPVRDAAPWFVRLCKDGDLGVPMFFVISGYCMIASVRASVRQSESVGAFLLRRSLRIYPPFWCSLLVVASVPFVIEGLSALKTGRFVTPSAHVSNFGFLDFGIIEWLRVATLTQVFAPLGPADPQNLQYKFTAINAVYWTLAIEFQFYLVMAVALALRARAVAWLGLVTIVSVPVAYFGAADATGIFLPYWPMFAIGIAVFLLLEHDVTCARVAGSHWRLAASAGVAALGAVFVARTLAGHETRPTGFALGFGGALWFLHEFERLYTTGLKSANRAVRIPLAALECFGLMSYSLYLLHGRVQFVAQQFARQLLAPGIALDAVAISLTCSGCYVFYLLCEKPFIRTRTLVQTVSEAQIRAIA